MSQVAQNPQAVESQGVERFWVHAGPLGLEVRVARGLVYDCNGEEAMSTIDSEKSILWISRSLPVLKRIPAVLAEMYNAHDALFGEPSTGAAASIRRQIVFTQFSKDLNRQGGADTLLALQPAEKRT
jgi:hypothetical protein